VVGEEIFARRCRSLQRSPEKIRNIFKINNTYKFFFLQGWVAFGNIIEMV